MTSDINYVMLPIFNLREYTVKEGHKLMYGTPQNFFKKFLQLPVPYILVVETTITKNIFLLRYSKCKKICNSIKNDRYPVGRYGTGSYLYDTNSNLAMVRREKRTVIIIIIIII